MTLNQNTPWKRLICIIFALSLLLVACQPDAQVAVDDGGNGAVGNVDGEVVINFHAWNDQPQQRFEEVVVLPEGVSVNWVITPNEGNAFQLSLFDNLLNNPGAIDLFVVNIDQIRNFVEPGTTLSIFDDIGLTQNDLQHMYIYTLEAATGSDGVLRALSWEANPGLFAYRRSIAQEVFGTDDPEYIHSRISTWEGFNEVAHLMAEHGYQMLSGFDDSFRVFANNISAPWVNENNEIVVDQRIHDWIDQTLYFTQNGFNNRSSLWDSVWTSDQGLGGTVFGFFYATWGIEFTLLANSLEVPVAEGGLLEVGNGLFGDWAVTHGPDSFYWGGTWILAPESSTLDRELIRSIMYQMTVDRDNLRTIVDEFGNFVNHSELMEEIASDPDFGNDFLGGQNHIALFAQTAPNITAENISPFDQAMVEAVQTSMSDYFNGLVDRDTAWDNFFTIVTTLHPHLQRPAS